jgi:hypothetical protein
MIEADKKLLLLEDVAMTITFTMPVLDSLLCLLPFCVLGLFVLFGASGSESDLV